MNVKFKPLIYGLLTFLPWVNRYYKKGTGGTTSARYCYSIWLRHLVMAKNSGLNPFPRIVAELGPGDSLGIGFAALISGCDKYYAFDVVEYATEERNKLIFDELLILFKNKEKIPDNNEFPNAKPILKTYDFPGDILNEERLQYALEKSRIEKIREFISNHQQKESPIEYKVPWYSTSILEKESVDMIYSQAVLEHVDNLRVTYKSMRLWLAQTGFISHQIDFKCHGTADKWNGHWAYSDLMWKLIRGKRQYLLNREPHSTHTSILNDEGFRIICNIAFVTDSSISREDLATRYKNISNDDLTTSGAFIQATKNI
jgi:hypothetical protein